MSPAHDPYQALRYPEYRWYLFGTWTSAMALLIQSVVIGWQVYDITHSALSLGMVGLAEALPCLGLILFGGHAADRMDRRKLYGLSMLVFLAGGITLWLLNTGTPLRSAWPFYLVQAALGAGRAFSRPASQAMRTEILPREALVNGATWASSTFQTAMVLGPAAGGLILGYGSPRTAYGVEVVLLTLSLLSVLRLRPRPMAAPSETRMWQSMKEGLSFVWNNQVLLGALSLDLFAVLFGGAPALLPIFASEVLKVGPQGLGWLRAAPAVGSVTMAFVLAHFPSTARSGRALLVSVGLFGLCWIAFAVSTSFALSLGLLAVSGALDNVSVVLRQSLLQIRTPSALMGRVSAVSSFFITSSNEIGAFESGVAARVLGLVPSVIFGGIMTLGVVSLTAWRAPELRRLRRI